MKLNRLVLAISLAAMACAPTFALTAVCKNATGRMFGIHGAALGGKSFDVADAISKATFTLLWTKGEKEARIVTQSTGGGAPITEHAFLVFNTDEQVTFLVPFESSIWFYSIYPGPKALIMTAHNNGAAVDSGGAVVKSYIAQCEIGD